MKARDIIAHWRIKYQYIHPRKIYDIRFCSEGAGWYCCSPYCPTHARRWATKHMNKMNLAAGMKAFRLILPVGDIVPPPMLSQIWENFAKKLRRLHPDCEWYWVLELQGNNLHYHVIVTTGDDMSRAAITDKWLKTLAKKKLVPTEDVMVDMIDENYATVSAYNVKRCKEDAVSKRPAYGLYRNLAMGSRGFGA